MNRFKSMFDVVSKENADAATIPVVLELDVKPAEGQTSDVAADPATTEPATDAATTEQAAPEGQNLDTTAVPAEQVVTSQCDQAPAPEQVSNAPAQNTPDATVAVSQPAEGGEGQEQEVDVNISFEEEVAIAEAEAEKNELLNEAEVVDDTVAKMEEDSAAIKESLDANDKLVAEGGEEIITPANVAIAVQSYELRLERLGLNLQDLVSSANISKETFVSKENGGMGMKPSDVLRNLHNDMCREDGVMDKIKAGGAAVWKAIVDAIKKVIEFISKLLPNQIESLKTLREKVESSDIKEAEIAIGKIAPAYALCDVSGPLVANMVLKNLKETVDANNRFVNTIKLENSEELEKSIKNEVFDALPKINFGGKEIKALAVLRKKASGYILENGDYVATSIPVEETDAKDNYTKEKVVKTIDDLIKADGAAKQYHESMRKMVKNFESMLNNEGKFKTFLSNTKIKKFYSSIINDAMKSIAEANAFGLAVGKEFLASGKKEAEETK